jgi:hypothetical protein
MEDSSYSIFFTIKIERIFIFSAKAWAVLSKKLDQKKKIQPPSN